MNCLELEKYKQSSISKRSMIYSSSSSSGSCVHAVVFLSVVKKLSVECSSGLKFYLHTSSN